MNIRPGNLEIAQGHVNIVRTTTKITYKIESGKHDKIFFPKTLKLFVGNT